VTIKTCLLLVTTLLACEGARRIADDATATPLAGVPQPAAVAPEPADEPAAPASASKTASEPEPAPPRPFGIAEPTAEQLAVVAAGEVDKIPWIVTRKHYVVSNEARHDLFFPYIENKGGIYVGVASDPNYTLIAVAKPEFAFLLDIDRQVIDMHAIYRAFIAASPDPETLRRRFSKREVKRSLELLAEALADEEPKAQRRIRELFVEVHEIVHESLGKVAQRERDGEGTSWLSNDEYYGYIKRMFEVGRIRVMPGNLLGAHTMRSIADAARGLDLPVRVFYPSNAEDYFSYGDGYRDNVRAFPIDESSIVIRTIATNPLHSEYGRTLPKADHRWHYQVQPLSDLQAWLEREKSHRNFMLKAATRNGTMSHETGHKGLSEVGMKSEPRGS
jgi:hypothetical protein